MRQIIKRAAAIAGIVAMMATAAGCSKKTDSDSITSKTVTQAKDYVYSIERIDVAGYSNSDNYYSMSRCGDMIYMTGNSYLKDNSTYYRLATLSSDGTGFSENNLHLSEDEYFPSNCMGDDGYLYVVINDYNYDTDYHDNYYLAKYDTTFTQVWRTALSEMGPNDDGYYYTNGMAYSSSYGLCLLDTNGVSLYDTETGELIKQIATSDTTSEWGRLYSTPNGNLYATKYSDGSDYIYELDVEKGILSETNYTKLGDVYSLKPGISYDFIGTNNVGIYGFNVGDESPTMLLNYIDSNIDTYGLDLCVQISETEFLSFFDNGDGTQFYKLTKVDPKDVADRKIITLGCYYVDYDVRKRIVNFNQNSDEYKISIIDYSKYNTDDDYTAGLTQLNNDIVSGNTPDIIELSSWMPYESYYAKGLFEDLTSRFENDEELSKIEYLDNILEAFKYNGKMYAVIPGFAVNTVAVKKSIYDSVDSWTMDSLEQLMDEMDADPTLFAGIQTRESIFNNILQMAGSNFIDFSSKECKYTSDDFKAILKLVESVPVEVDEAYWENDNSAFYRENTSFLEVLNFCSFTQYNYVKKGDFGEDIVLAGFPSENGGMSSITPSMRLCMSASSQYKDAVWEFLRYFYTDEYQCSDDGIASNGVWPVSLNAIDNLAAEAKKKPTYTDDNGIEVEYDMTYYIGNNEIIINPITDDEVNEVVEFLKSLDNVAYSDTSVKTIIDEEASAYFSGQKTVDEVTDIIQSRVKIYVEENS